MPKQCELCNKQANKANKVSFSNKHHTYRQKPNLQAVRAVINGKVKKVLVCTSCLKANKIKKAV